MGYQFLVIALRSGGEFSVIGAFRYASSCGRWASATSCGATCPTRWRLAGIVVIVASGLYILHRERVRR